ncbi:MAG: hypothetical protein ACLT4O_09580 [Clostridia bacterium]
MNRLQSLDPRIRKLMRAICFCLLFVILFVFLSGAFIPRTGTTEDGMESRISKAYRGEPRDSIDTVFIGNSDIYRAISPVDLFHQTGITSAIAGRPNKQLSEVPGDIRDILRYQNPKTIVLETDCMFSGTNPGFKKGISPLEAEAAKVDVAGQAPSKATNADVAGQAPSKATDAAHQNIFAKCKALLQEGDSAFLAALNYKFPLVKYHDNWKHLKLTTFLQPRGKYHFSNKGMAYANTVKAYPFGNEYMQLSGGKHAMLSEEKLDQFQKIYDLCDRNGIRLVLLTVPSANTWNKGKSDTVKQLAKKYDLTYYDYNRQLPAGFDWATDSKDGGNHLNYAGASAVTKDLAKKLTDDLTMNPTSLTKEQKQQWKKDYEHFHKSIVK